MMPTSLMQTRLLLVILLALFVLPTVSFAQFGLNQEPISEAEWSRGFHGFNMIADSRELERISVRQFRRSKPEEVLLVVIGNLHNLRVNVTNHVGRGGAALLACDSTVPRPDASFAGVRFGRLDSYPTNESDAFGGMRDCPVISTFQDHPIVSGIGSIATNNPGYLWASDRTTIGWLPTSYQPMTSGAFIAADENRNGGRVVAIGDQSIFTNQMILHRDNLQFTNQTFKWLKDDRRKKILILVNGSEHYALGPSDVVVDMPAPSPEEVADALQDLPPSAMLEFANSIATVVEDENMVNDFIHDTVDKVPERFVTRFYIFLMFFIACLAFIAAFLFQRKLQRQTASELAFKRSNREQSELKVIQSRERQQAAHLLLDRFCRDVAYRRFNDWPSFPTGLNVDEDRESKNIFASMTKMSVLYKSKTSSFWTRAKLSSLEKKVNQWRAYFEGRSTLVDAELVQNQAPWPTELASRELSPSEFN